MQQFIDNENFSPAQVFNEDEPGIHWCMPLKYQFTMDNAYRSYTPEGDDSGRFTVITVQNKAWNDMVGMIMHIRLQLGPFRRRNFQGKKCLLVVDNCGCHKVRLVQQEMEANGWAIRYFPPNMTGELQPMDLVANSTCKQALRKFRINQCLESLTEFRVAYHSAIQSGASKLPKFKPPQPTYIDGVLQMIGLMRGQFQEQTFKDSMRRCFVKVGFARGPNGWLKYMRQSFGMIARRLTSEERTVLEDNPNLELSDLLMSISLRSEGGDEDF